MAAISLLILAIVGLVMISDPEVVTTGDNTYGQCNVSDWQDIIAITAADHQTLGLKSDGTVIAIGKIGILNMMYPIGKVLQPSQPGCCTQSA